MFKIIATCVASIAFSFTTAAGASAQSSQEVPPVKISKDWPQDAIEWNRGRGAINYSVVPFSNNSGQLVLCGAVQYQGTKGAKSVEVVRELQLEMNGRRVVKNFSWMPVITRGESFVGKEAGCRVYTKVTVPKDASFGLSLGKSRF